MAGKVPMLPVNPRSRKDVMKSSTRKGFRRRWIVNTPEQIQRFEEDEGYALAKDGKSDAPVTRREYVLVEIPEELYQAKQADKVRRILSDRAGMAASQQARRELRALSERDDSRGQVSVIGGVELTGHGTGKVPTDED